MIKKIFVLLIALAFIGVSVPSALAAQQDQGQICGVAKDANQAPLPAGTTVRLRNAANGQVAGETKTDNQGGFCFAGLPAGNYIVEIVDGTGKIIGTSASIGLAAGAMVVSGISVASSVAGAAAAVAGGSFFTSTAGIVLLAGVGGAVVIGAIAATGDASSSK